MNCGIGNAEIGKLKGCCQIPVHTAGCIDRTPSMGISDGQASEFLASLNGFSVLATIQPCSAIRTLFSIRSSCKRNINMGNRVTVCGKIKVCGWNGRRV